MKAEIISVGTELLLGDTVNTNAADIAKELALLGITCYNQSVVGDNPLRLKEAIQSAFSRSDMIITTGGLGPTYDDLTKETIAEYFSVPLELHEKSYKMLLDRFKLIDRPMTENNKKQAYMPKGATILYNDRGTANGVVLEKDNKIAVMLPGPPREMTAMLKNQLEPYLRTKSDSVFVSKNIHFYGIGESQLETDLHDYMIEQENPTIAPYAKEGELLVRVTAKANTAKEAEKLLQPVIEKLCRRYPNEIYGIDVDSLQQALVNELKKAGKTIATAESCTGGFISKRITDIDGSSEVFGYGVVTYANEAKVELLGVKQETIKKYGAVSKKVAIEMAEGIRKKAGASFGLSTTGIAGPTGGSYNKPIGLVYVALASEKGSKTIELNLSRAYGGEREFIRYSASSYALNLVLRELMPKFKLEKE